MIKRVHGLEGFLVASLVLVSFLPNWAFGNTDDPEFARYQPILDRMPFGRPAEATTIQPVPEPTGPITPSWTEGYRLTMIMVDEAGRPRIGLVNVQDKSSFTLGVEDGPIYGIRLRSVDYQGQRAVLDKAGDVQEIGMLEPGLVERKLSKAALDAHLRKYQMNVLRYGPPPLPVPLTAEMDRQLVKEGLLPPMDLNRP